MFCIHVELKRVGNTNKNRNRNMYKIILYFLNGPLCPYMVIHCYLYFSWNPEISPSIFFLLRSPTLILCPYIIYCYLYCSRNPEISPKYFTNTFFVIWSHVNQKCVGDISEFHENINNNRWPYMGIWNLVRDHLKIFW